MKMIRFIIEFDIVEAELGVKADNSQRVAAAESFARTLDDRVFGLGFLPSGLKLIGNPAVQYQARNAEID
jgi:hypothetical protein